MRRGVLLSGRPLFSIPRGRGDMSPRALKLATEIQLHQPRIGRENRKTESRKKGNGHSFFPQPRTLIPEMPQPESEILPPNSCAKLNDGIM